MLNWVRDRWAKWSRPRLHPRAPGRYKPRALEALERRVLFSTWTPTDAFAADSHDQFLHIGVGWDVVLIDKSLPSDSTLARAMLPGGKVIRFDGRKESATKVLNRVIDWADETGSSIKTLSLLAHASGGTFALGKDWISNSTFSKTADAWSDLGSVMTPDASINLYGCSLASPASDGQVLINRVANTVGANVFASNNITGRGGDWVLEAASASITGEPQEAPSQAISPFNTAALLQWNGTLAAPAAADDSYSLNEDSSIVVGPPTNNLANRWKFDDGAGQIAADSGTSANSGTLGSTGGADSNDPTWTTGHLGTGALSFDGVDDYVATTSTVAKTASSFTLSAWFQTNTTTSQHHILWEGYSTGDGNGGAAGDATTSEMNLSIGTYSAPDKIEFFMGYDVPANGADSIYIVSSSNFTDTTRWHHAAVTVTDLGGGTFSASLYVDGVFEGSDTGIQNDRSNWGALQIGKPGAATRYFDGKIDDVRVYDAALSAGQVQSLVQGGVLANDSDADGDFPIVNLSTVTTPANGVLSINDDGSFTYTPNANFSGTDTFTYQANDGTSDSNIATVTFNVTAINDAPSLAGANNFTAINEDNTTSTGTLVSALISTQITDADSSASSGIAITAADATNGSWQYSTNGTTWSALGTVSTGAARLLAADANTRVRFVPNPDFNGTVNPGITFVAWDQTSGVAGSTADVTTRGGATAFSTATAASAITVNAVNDAPAIASLTSGSGLNFDGVDDVVSIPASASLAATTALSVEAWVFPRGGTSGNQMIINKEGEYELARMADGTLAFAIANTSPGWNWTSTGYVLPSNTWTHVAITYDGNSIVAYVNGAAVSTTPATGTIGDAHPGFEDLTIGGRQNASNQRFKGAIDEVRVWTVARTAGQIAAAYNTLLVGNEAGLAGNWRFDEGQGTTVADLSPNANNGTLGAGVTAARPAWIVDAYTTSEDTLLSTSAPGVLTGAGDVDGDTLTAILVTGPTHASSFTLNSNGSFTYTPAANYNGSDSFTFKANDGSADSNVVTVNLTITAVNDAPALAGANNLTTINEDNTTSTGRSVTAILSGQVTDNDSGASSGMAVTGVDDTNGTWQYTTDGGTNWNAFGSVSNASARLLPASANYRVRFVPNANYNGTVTGGLTFRAWDQTTGAAGSTADTTTNGGSTAFSSTTASSSITITAVNDAPVNTVPVITVITNEDTTLTSTSSSNGISISDIDAGSSAVRVTLSVTNGSLTLAGTTGLTFSVGDGTADSTMTFTGTVTAINTALDGLSYAPTANYNGSDTFTITTNDQGNTGSGGSLSDTDTVAITINAVNDAPVLSGSNALTAINEDNTTSTGTLVSSLISSQTSDADSGASTGIAITAVNNTNGTWEYTTNGGTNWFSLGTPTAAAARLLAADANTRVRFVPNANFNGTVSSAITFRAWDQTSGSAGSTANVSTNGGATAFSSATASSSIVVNSVNDAPAGADKTISGTEDTAYTFAASDFGLSDVNDSPANSLLGVKITTLPVAGTLLNNAVAVTAGQTISLSDLNAGLLTYTPDADGNGTGYSNFTFQVQDNGGTANSGVDLDASPNTITFNVASVNDAPVNSVPGPQVMPVNTPKIFSTANSNLISIVDVDAGSSAVRITLTSTNGTMTLSGTTGLSFTTGNGTANTSMTFTGTLTDINAALDGLTFNPTTSFTGAASISVTSNDQGNSGSGGTLITTDSIAIQVGGVKFQEGVNGYTGTEDTEIDSPLPDTNKGSATTVRVDQDHTSAGGGPSQGLIQFSNVFGSGAGQIPFGSTINSASLTVYVIERSGSGVVTLHRMLANWTEASTYNTLTGGIQFNDVEAASAIDSTLPSANGTGFKTFSGLSSALQSWSNGTANHGWAIAIDNTDGWEFNSSENATASQRPYLTISYTPPQPPVLNLDANNSSGVTGFDYAGTFTENGGPVPIADVDALITDADSTNLVSMTATITNLLDPTFASLAATTTGTSIIASYNSTTGVLSLTGTDTVAHYQQVLRTLTYNNTSENPTTVSRVITISVNDGISNSNVGTATIAMTALNDAPVNSVPGTQTINEDTTRVFSSGNGNLILISDVDINSGAVQVTLTAANGTISLSGTSGLSFSSGTGTADASMVFTGTPTNVNAALAGLSFTPTLNFNGTASITITTDDQGNSGAGGPMSDTDVVSITVNAVNDAPVTTTTGTTLAYTENDGAVVIDSGLTVADVDNANLSSATVSITANYSSGQDVLSFTNQSGITGSWNSGTGVLTLSGSASVAAYQAALRTVTYTNTSEVPSTAARTISFRASDGALNSVAVTRSVSVASVNDAPTFTAPASGSTNEDTALVFSSGNGNSIVLGDVDAGASVVQVSLGITNGTLTLASIAGLSFTTGDGSADATMTFTGTIAAINTALNGLSFTPAADYNGLATLSANADDLGNTGTGGSKTASASIAITVAAVNDAPVLSGTANLPGINEDDTTSTGTLVSTLISGHVSEPDTGGSSGIAITAADNTNGAWQYSTDSGGSWSAISGISNASALLLAADASTRVRFVPNANYNGVVSGITFRAWDQTSGTAGSSASTTTNGGSSAFSSATATASITVAAVNDAPTISNPATGTTNEDTALTFSTGNSNAISIADIDSASSAVQLTLTVTNGTLTLAGTTGLFFITGDGSADATMTFTGTVSAINTALNGLVFNPTADYNGPAALSINLNDQGNTGAGGSQTASASVAVTVVAVNDAPVLSGTANLPGINEDNITSSGELVSNLLSGQVTDADAGASSGIAITSVDNANGSWQFSTDGGGSWSAIGAVSNSASLLLASDANTRVRFTPNADFNGTVSGITFRAWDQTTGTIGSTANTTTNGGSTAFSSATATASITVAAVNDAPTISNPSTGTTNEDTALVFSTGNGNAISIGDVDAGSSAVQVVLSVTNGTITLSGTTGLSFSTGDGTADSTMTFTGTLTAINTALNGLTFAPAADYNGGSTLSINVDDQGNTGSSGSQTASASVAITVVAVNDAPVLSGTANMPGINEDNTTSSGVLVSNLLSGHVTDADSGASGGIAITSVDNTNGSWQYSTDSGGSWNAISGVANSSALLLAADASTRVRFVPNADFNGTVSGITFRAWDQTTGTIGGTANTTANGGSTAFSSATATASIVVAAINDAPTISNPATGTTNEDTSLTFSTGNGNAISIGDVDAGSSAIQLVLSVTNGTLTLAGTAGLSFVTGDGTADSTMTFTGTFAAINTALNGLTFAPAADYNGGSTLSINVDDQGNTGAGGSLTASASVAITVVAVNDAPVLSGTANLPSINEDDTTSSGQLVSTLISGHVTEADAGAISGIAITSVDNTNGSWQFSANGGTSWTNITGVSTASARLLAANANTRVRFVPGPDFNGTVAGLTFRAWDQTSGTAGATANTTSNGGGTAFSTATATASIIVIAVNDAPIATDDAYTTAEDTPLVVTPAGVLANDADVDVDPLTAVVVTGPSHGSLSLASDGSLTYTPDANYHGPDSFTYKANDGGLDSNVATVDLTVTSVNDVPVTTDNDYAVTEDTPLVIKAAAGVLANDSDVDGDTLAASVVTGPAHGSLQLNADGSFEYTPDADYNGPDAFTYAADDGSGGTTNATVTLDVAAVNDDPVTTGPANQLGVEDTSIVFSAANGNSILVSDVDLLSGQVLVTLRGTRGSVTLSTLSGLTMQIGTGTDDSIVQFSGTLANVNAALEGLVFQPSANANGAANLRITVSDQGNTGAGGPKTTVRDIAIDLTSVNDVPVASDDAYTTDEDTPLVIDAMGGVIANDTDADLDTLSTVVVTPPTHGSLAMNADGSFAYTPDQDYNGPDSFTYHATDGTANSADATVNLNVVAVNDAPVEMGPGPIRSRADKPIVFSALNGSGISISDVDLDGGEIVVSVRAARGTVTLGRTDGVTFQIGTGSRDVVAQFSGLLRDVNAALEGLTFIPRAGYEGRAGVRIVSSDQGQHGAGGPQTTMLDLLIQLTPGPHSDNSTPDSGGTAEPTTTTSDDLFSGDDSETHTEHDGKGRGGVTPVAVPPRIAPQLQRPGTAEEAAVVNNPGASSSRKSGRTKDAEGVSRNVPRMETSTVAAKQVEGLERYGSLGVAASAERSMLSSTSAFAKQLEKLTQDLASGSEMGNLTVGSTSIATAIGTAGYVVWCIRSGSLVAAMLQSLPLWRWFDPIPVIDHEELAPARKTRRKRRGKPDLVEQDVEEEKLRHMLDGTQKQTGRADGGNET